MIEEILIEHLSAKLNVPVKAEIPSNPPSSFVIVEKAGGSEYNHIHRANFAIQSYAKSMLDAAKLNEAVKTAMRSMAENKSVSAAKLETDYNFTDTTTKVYRYQAIYNVTYMEG